MSAQQARPALNSSALTARRAAMLTSILGTNGNLGTKAAGQVGEWALHHLTAAANGHSLGPTRF